jgi:hypothetical protein
MRRARARLLLDAHGPFRKPRLVLPWYPAALPLLISEDGLTGEAGTEIHG